MDASQTFRRHEILLIGGNGFLGKVVLGMLLDRYPDLKHLYVLVRPKAGLPAEERFQKEVLGSPALAGLEDARRKITVLAGDIAEAGCGLDEPALAQLAGRVGLIINCAGLVEFFPAVDQSFRSNVDGVENLLALTRRLGAKLVHISTCYVCGEADGLIEETEPIVGFYPRRQGPGDHSFDHRNEIAYCRERVRQIYESAARKGESLRSKGLEKRLTELGRQRAEHWGWVNTYTYAKSLGEQLIASEDGLDWAIVRPAIVESALEFPFPGWVEGGRTAAPLVLMAMGGMRHWTVRKDAPIEVVPVDMVAASILMVSALLLEGRAERVYQLGTADVNPILLEPLVHLLHAESRRQEHRRRGGIPLPARRAPLRIISAHEARARRRRLERRLSGARTVVMRLRKMLEAAGLPGRRPLAAVALALRTLGLQVAFREQTLELYQPFILNNRFIFESENIRKAQALLSEKDRRLLQWRPERIDWADYWINHQVKGIQKWLQPQAVKGWMFKV